MFGLFSLISLIFDVSPIYAAVIEADGRGRKNTDDVKWGIFYLLEAFRVARTYRFLLLFHYFNCRNEDDAEWLAIGQDDEKSEEKTDVSSLRLSTEVPSNATAAKGVDDVEEDYTPSRGSIEVDNLIQDHNSSLQPFPDVRRESKLKRKHQSTQQHNIIHD